MRLTDKKAAIAAAFNYCIGLIVLLAGCNLAKCAFSKGSPKQLIKEMRTPITRKPGSDVKQDFEYKRCGVASIFIVNDS